MAVGKWLGIILIGASLLYCILIGMIYIAEECPYVYGIILLVLLIASLFGEFIKNQHLINQALTHGVMEMDRHVYYRVKARVYKRAVVYELIPFDTSSFDRFYVRRRELIEMITPKKVGSMNRYKIIGQKRRK